MKRKPIFKEPVLKKQSVKKKKRNRLSGLRKNLVLMGGIFVKVLCVLLALVIISFTFVSLYEYLLKSPLLRLEEVIVEGVDEELKGGLMKIADLNSDLSLLAIDIHELKKKMESHPWIRSVNLEKRFPHTLVVQAKKEEPWAVVTLDKLYYMNQWGTLFKEADPKGHLDYPVITGVARHGEGNEKDLQTAVRVLKILESEKEPWSLKDVGEVHVRKDGDVYLYFSSLPAVIQSNSFGLEKRMKDLKKVVAHLNDTGRTQLVKSINLNYRDGAVVAYRNS